MSYSQKAKRRPARQRSAETNGQVSTTILHQDNTPSQEFDEKSPHTLIEFICCDQCAGRAAQKMRESGFGVREYSCLRHLAINGSMMQVVRMLCDVGFTWVKSRKSEARAAFIVDRGNGHE